MTFKDFKCMSLSFPFIIFRKVKRKKTCSRSCFKGISLSELRGGLPQFIFFFFYLFTRRSVRLQHSCLDKREKKKKEIRPFFNRKKCVMSSGRRARRMNNLWFPRMFLFWRQSLFVVVVCFFGWKASFAGMHIFVRR